MKITLTPDQLEISRRIAFEQSCSVDRAASQLLELGMKQKAASDLRLASAVNFLRISEEGSATDAALEGLYQAMTGRSV